MLTAIAELPTFGLIRGAGTILVVEDEEMIRLCVTEFLQDSGFNVLQAANVAEARAIIENNKQIDLVFSDINMPGAENGFALAELILREYPYIKVLLTSGMPQPEQDTKDLLEPLIHKPYCYNSVLYRIQNLLQRSTVIRSIPLAQALPLGCSLQRGGRP